MEEDEFLQPNRRSRIKKFGSGFHPVIKLPHFRLSSLFRHKFWAGGIIVSAALIVFMGGAIYRGYFTTFANTAQNILSGGTPINKTNNSLASSAQPSLISPSPSPSENAVLGSSDDTSSDTSDDSDTSSDPSIAPVPTDVPEPTETPSTSTDDSSSGNSNCSTAAGTPNSWYSDVYPASPISASSGSVTLTVDIRDCNINNVSSSSTLKISLSSGDPNTQVNGQSLPVSISTQNGQASFTVSSQVDGTVALTIQDTTDSFGITDTENNSPSIVFSGSSSTPTPTQSPTPTQTISSTPTGIQTPTPTP